MAYNDDYDNDDHDVRRRTTTTTRTDTGRSGAGIGAGVLIVLLVLALAIGAWYLLNERPDTTVRGVGNEVTESIREGTDKAKDAAAEVPQAGKDAVTEGDQSTTRPNKDGSTGNLDQK